MNIIPVIDLLNGTVVHAKQGQRDSYQAIESQLTHSNKPLDIIAALLTLHPFKTLYIADLNSIQHTPTPHEDNFSVIEAITKAYPTLDLWIDVGITDIASLRKWQTLKVKIILGSENFPSHALYQAVTDSIANDYCLSLDFMHKGFNGDPNILSNTTRWPSKVIVMTIKRVGSNHGPDIRQLVEIRSKNPTVDIIAAGGVRNINDLIQLKKNQINGALIATALHQQQITGTDLQHFSQTK